MWLSGIRAWGKNWASLPAPPLRHTQDFPGATQSPSWTRPHAVRVTNGPRVRSGFPGPQPHSALSLIKPESLLGPQDRVPTSDLHADAALDAVGHELELRPVQADRHRADGEGVAGAIPLYDIHAAGLQDPPVQEPLP